MGSSTHGGRLRCLGGGQFTMPVAAAAEPDTGQEFGEHVPRVRERSDSTARTTRACRLRRRCGGDSRGFAAQSVVA
jgi:hypothetical protein